MQAFEHLLFCDYKQTKQTKDYRTQIEVNKPKPRKKLMDNDE
jgi:hypothetical protein